MSTWTMKDELHALSQGYSIFTVDNGLVEIQRVDDPPAHYLWTEEMGEESKFSSDEEAIDHVKKMAEKGNVTAQKALALSNP